MREIGESLLDDIALGAAILGTGGGGDPYVGKLLARQAIREFGPVAIADLADIPDDAFIIPSAMMGAPTVMVEKLPRGDEVVRAFKQLERFLGRSAAYTMAIEIGGINSMIPFCLAARLRLPMVDADLMGRAFPELQMCTPGIHGIAAAPMGIADDKGNTSIIDAVDNLWTERLARSATIDMGCAALIALYPMSGAELRRSAIRGSLTVAEELGRLIRETREGHGDTIAAILERVRGHRLFTGKVTDVERRTEKGFAKAVARIGGMDLDVGSELQLFTQNEHLVAQRDDKVVASVPDLIIVLDSETGLPITTEELRYGLRVTVIGAPAPAPWRTRAGLEIVGPRYFGYDFDYVPIEERIAMGTGA